MSQFNMLSFNGRICLGPGAVAQLGSVLREADVQKCLVVTDEVLMQVGVTPRAVESIKRAGVTAEIFDKVLPDPPSAMIAAGVDRFASAGCDAIVAVGGGSSIDTAKGIGIVAANGGKIMDYEGVDKVDKPLPLFAAVPTTYGSGSEASAFAIITDESRNFKVAIGSRYIIPDIALVDSDLMKGLPKGLSASVMLDALSHAIESYVSRLAQPISDGLALRAMTLIAENLDEVLSGSDDDDAILAAATASCMGGMAFSQTRLGLVHAMAHPFGAYFHVPHGVTCALLLPPVMQFNCIEVPGRFADIAVALGDAADGADDQAAAQRSVRMVTQMVARAQIPLKLSEFGVKTSDIGKMADDTMLSGNVKINPRLSTRQQIVEIFESCL